MVAPILDITNGVLRTLETDDLAAIRPHLSLVDLKRGTVLSSLQAPLKDTLFVESGVISVAATSPGGRAVEVLKIGRDGFLGTPVLLGAERAATATVQLAGQVHAIPADVLLGLMNERPALRAALLAYMTRCLDQTAETALSHAVCTLRQKVARWILMTLDQIDDIWFPFTHEEVARMLGARRASVTIAVQELEGKGAIAAGRARLDLCDRTLLEESAGEAYDSTSPRGSESRNLNSKSLVFEGAKPPD